MNVTKGKGYRYIYLIRSCNQNYNNKDDGIVHIIKFISDFIRKNYQWTDIMFPALIFGFIVCYTYLDLKQKLNSLDTS